MPTLPTAGSPATRLQGNKFARMTRYRKGDHSREQRGCKLVLGDFAERFTKQSTLLARTVDTVREGNEVGARRTRHFLSGRWERPNGDKEAADEWVAASLCAGRGRYAITVVDFPVALLLPVLDLSLPGSPSDPSWCWCLYSVELHGPVVCAAGPLASRYPFCFP